MEFASSLKRCAFSIAVAVLAGCGGSQPLIGNPGAAPQGRAIAQQAAHGKSWMLPEAKRDDLLYATDNAGFVHVFSYPAGKEVGTIVVAGNPQGACVDRAGNVWIARFRMTSVVEYAHGGTSSIGAVGTYPNNPWGCAVDPTTGNLAVTTTEGSIDVYANAQGDPTVYTVQGDGYGFTFCTYDDSGNLYATAPYSNIAELPKGSSEMTNMQLDFSINPWSIQWDERDKYLAVAGFKPKGQPTPIYHVGVSGTTGSLIGKTLLKGSTNFYPPQYWIEASRILGPGVAESLYGKVQSRVESWPYPAGGHRTRFAHVARYGHPALYGFVVSRAK